MSRNLHLSILNATPALPFSSHGMLNATPNLLFPFLSVCWMQHYLQPFLQYISTLQHTHHNVSVELGTTVQQWISPKPFQPRIFIISELHRILKEGNKGFIQLYMFYITNCQCQIVNNEINRLIREVVYLSADRIHITGTICSIRLLDQLVGPISWPRWTQLASHYINQRSSFSWFFFIKIWVASYLIAKGAQWRAEHSRK